MTARAQGQVNDAEYSIHEPAHAHATNPLWVSCPMKVPSGQLDKANLAEEGTTKTKRRRCAEGRQEEKVNHHHHHGLVSMFLHTGDCANLVH